MTQDQLQSARHLIESADSIDTVREAAVSLVVQVAHLLNKYDAARSLLADVARHSRPLSGGYDEKARTLLKGLVYTHETLPANTAEVTR